ncbi:VCBS repeat-containing protein, partial [Flavobacteriales bacterium AH-315-E23]|nr:VCBS repeat-containing protein [Flavobacteriales bacterium AH-315-E23]
MAYRYPSSTAFLILLLSSCSTDSEDGNLNNTPLPPTLFTEISGSQSGLSFVNLITEDSQRNIFNYEYFYNGGGVGVIDVNNDGLFDLFFTGNMVEDRLYLNLGGMKFRDITASAGVGGGNGWSTGVAIADVNADGFYDIYVSRSGPYTNPEMRKNHLFINNGNLTFTEQANAYGLGDKGYGTQAAFFDYDGDGDLDMYQVNHSLDFSRPMEKALWTNLNNQWSTDRLYRNDGKQRFTDVTNEAGVESDAFGLGIAVADLNGDQRIDIYVSNDYIEPDFMYINNGDGTFTDRIKQSTKHISNYGMGVDIGDFNNDGQQDIIVLDMLSEDYKRSKTMMGTMNIEKFWKSIDQGYHYQYMRNTLQLNNGNGSFSEIGQMAGVAKTDWSWAPLFADFDNDGYKDLFVTNGYKRDVSNQDFREYTRSAAKTMGGAVTLAVQQALDLIPSVKLRNQFFINNTDLEFSNLTDSAGIRTKSFSNGAAYADLDNDGDLDLVTNNINDPVMIYRNNFQGFNGNNYLAFDLPSNASSGTIIKVRQGDKAQIIQSSTTRGYLSSVSPRLHFGVGTANAVDEVLVTWPNGRQQKVRVTGVNKVVTVAYTPDDKPSVKGQKSQAVLVQISGDQFADYEHEENEFNDFETEILLPHKLSEQGPFLAKGDVNGDGLEDFFIGGAAGYSGKMFHQTKEGKFEVTGFRLWENRKNCEDMGIALFDADTDGDLDLYIVSGGYEFEQQSPLLQDRLYINDGSGIFTDAEDLLPDNLKSGSCVKPCDFDNDGDLDLFIGGRVVPGAYPGSPGSTLLENNGGKFSDITMGNAPDFAKLGMVTDALWEDIDGDQDMDLIVVGEFMPITVFINDDGIFTDRTSDFGLSNTRGWWNSINSGDFDDDGDMDFVVGNLGLNSKYKVSRRHPLHLYANDFDQTGTLDLILAKHTDSSLVPIRGKECTSDQMPFIDEKYPTYESF